MRGGEGPEPAVLCRECLEQQRLSDGRYQLQRLPGGRVALPVLQEKLSQLCLPPEVPCELLRIQVGRAASPCALRGPGPQCHIPAAGPCPLQGRPPALACPEAAG